MNNKGVTLIELLIVIVIMGIIASFGSIIVSEILENVRKNAFVTNATIIYDAGKDAYSQDSEIWDDDVATLGELIQANYIKRIGSDPWGGSYDLNETYVTVSQITSNSTSSSSGLTFLSNASLATFKIRVVSSTAVIGYYNLLDEWTKADVIIVDANSLSLLDKLTGNFDNFNDNVNGSVLDDTVTVGNDIEDDANIQTYGGDDTIDVGDDIKNDASIDTGGGDDTIVMDGEIRDNATVDTGEGNDTLSIGDDIQNNAVVTTGDGDDIVTVDDDLQTGATLDTGAGNDTVTIGDDLDRGTLLTGDGDDTINLDTLKKTSTIDTGDDNDTLYIKNVSSTFDNGTVTMGAGDDTLTIDDKTGSTKDLKGTDGTFDGGAGNDTLNLPYITIDQWNDYVSDLFTGFETVNLQDGTVYP